MADLARYLLALFLAAVVVGFGCWLAELAVDARRRSHPGVEVNRDRLSGTPAIRGTRVPAEFVARTAGQPGGRKLLRAYDINRRQTRAASRWWKEQDRG